MDDSLHVLFGVQICYWLLDWQLLILLPVLFVSQQVLIVLHQMARRPMSKRILVNFIVVRLVLLGLVGQLPLTHKWRIYGIYDFLGGTNIKNHWYFQQEKQLFSTYLSFFVIFWLYKGKKLFIFHPNMVQNLLTPCTKRIFI